MALNKDVVEMARDAMKNCPVKGFSLRTITLSLITDDDVRYEASWSGDTTEGLFKSVEKYLGEEVPSVSDGYLQLVGQSPENDCMTSITVPLESEESDDAPEDVSDEEAKEKYKEAFTKYAKMFPSFGMPYYQCTKFTCDTTDNKDKNSCQGNCCNNKVDPAKFAEMKAEMNKKVEEFNELIKSFFNTVR